MACPVIRTPSLGRVMGEGHEVMVDGEEAMADGVVVVGGIGTCIMPLGFLGGPGQVGVTQLGRQFPPQGTRQHTLPMEPPSAMSKKSIRSKGKLNILRMPLMGSKNVSRSWERRGKRSEVTQVREEVYPPSPDGSIQGG